MDLLTFTVAMTKALTWPAVVVWLLWLLRTNLPAALAGLVGRLKSAKTPGMELTFSEGLDKVEEASPVANGSMVVLPNATVAKDEGVAAQPDLTVAALEAISELPPSYVIVQAWSNVQRELRLLIEARGLLQMQAAPQQRSYAPPNTINELFKLQTSNVLTRDEVAQLNELRRLRNQAAHEVDANITATDALRYSDFATNIINRLRSKREEIGR